MTDGWALGSGLDGRGVVVTGAAGAIGREVARAFAEAGSRVCLVDLDESAVEAVRSSLAEPDRHIAAALDLNRLAEHEPLLRRVRAECGSLWALAHVAAVLRRRASVDDVTEEDWDVQLDTNLKASFFLNRAAARVMREQGNGGRIVNFTSQGWWTGGFGGSVVYCASKGGIVSMSRGLARTFAADGITVNTVSPGAVDTPMMRGGLTDEAVEAFVGQIPVGRMAEPWELAGTVVFLASEHGRYITGATINVSGGFLMY
jgi:NAD(P)-dependent dehydrogenase (short-subunit alcohol dehydrogenase family)